MVSSRPMSSCLAPERSGGRSRAFRAAEAESETVGFYGKDIKSKIRNASSLREAGIA